MGSSTGRRTISGYGLRVDVNLGSGEIAHSEIDPAFARKFGGGMGFSAKILMDEVGPGVDPFGPENHVIIANGTLTGSGAVCASRTEVTTKSPLTGHLGTGNTGGMWGPVLKRAGIDLLVIKGEAAKPALLWIDEGRCELRSAGHLWGKDTYEAAELIERELSPSAPSQVRVMTIGPAGENRVRFACGMNDRYHCAARNGAGAVMGAKKLKAIAVRGSGLVRAALPGDFQDALRLARARVAEYEKLHSGFGIDSRARRVDPQGVGYWPARNFQGGAVANWEDTRGFHHTHKYVTGVLSPCHACPSPCFKAVTVKEGKYAGLTATRGTHPGAILEWGAKCGIDNLPAIWKCKQVCNQFGMDYASAGGVIAFAMELFERGIITTKDTDGLALTWGNEDAVVEMLRKIAVRDGFGDVLAEGSVRAAVAIGKGAERFVMATKGMEMMEYIDPRRGAMKGWSLGHLTSPRGGDNIKSTHFTADRYDPQWWVEQFDMFDEVKKVAYADPPKSVSNSWRGKPTMVKWFEDLHTVANALGMCIFPVSMGISLGPTHMSALLSAYTGVDTKPEDIMRMGERIYALMRLYISRQGLTRKDDHWPERFYSEPLPDGPAKGLVVSRAEIDSVLDEYFDLRGWHRSTGQVTDETISRLGLAETGD